MTSSEKFISKLNSNIFFKEFSFTKNEFFSIPNKEVQFSDHTVWIDDLLIIFQIKERNKTGDSTPQDEEKWFDPSPFCSECHHEGKLEYSHNGIEAKDSNSFYVIVSGLAKEFHLLKRMIDKGVAEPEDVKRYEEILSKINGLECTGCNQQFIHHEH